jgi:chromosome segregation ATPase
MCFIRVRNKKEPTVKLKNLQAQTRASDLQLQKSKTTTELEDCRNNSEAINLQKQALKTEHNVLSDALLNSREEIKRLTADKQVCDKQRIRLAATSQEMTRRAVSAESENTELRKKVSQLSGASAPASSANGSGGGLFSSIGSYLYGK